MNSDEHIELQTIVCADCCIHILDQACQGSTSRAQKSYRKTEPQPNIGIAQNFKLYIGPIFIQASITCVLYFGMQNMVIILIMAVFSYLRSKLRFRITEFICSG